MTTAAAAHPAEADADRPAMVGACTHCRAALPSPQQAPAFCCAGCRGVWTFLHGQGLGGFYQRRQQGGVLEPERLTPPGPEEAMTAYDHPACIAAQAEALPDGLLRWRWSVGGLHCASCVWILEQLPRLDPGIRYARVDWLRQELAISADPRRCPPSAQAALVARLGYRLRLGDDPALAGAQRQEQRLWLLRLGIAIAATFTSMHLSWSVLAGQSTASMPAEQARFLGALAWLAALPAATWCAAPFWRGAMAGLLLGRVNLDVSIVLVLMLGMAVSAISVLAGGINQYADAMAMFVAVLLLGRVVLRQAQDAVRGRGGPLDLLPVSARLDDGREIAAAALGAGQEFLVQDGEALPGDGEVLVCGASWLDQALLTGETRPRRLEVGDTVFAGCRLRGTPVRVRCTAAGAATRIGHLLHEAASAGHRPTPLTRVLDRMLAWFAPAVLLLAAAAFALWSWLDPGKALDQAIAVILVACPCAMGLAPPLAYARAVAEARRAGVLLRDGGAIEALAAPRHIVLDKTGTATLGRLRVTGCSWLVPEVERPQALAAMRALEEPSPHPLAGALLDWIAGQDIGDAVPCSQRSEHPGRGVQGLIGRHSWRIGNASFTGMDLPGNGAGTVLGLQRDDLPVAIIELADPLRAGLAEVLREWGGEWHLASGDAPAAVAAVAQQLEIADQHGGMLPEDKAALVARLAQDGATIMVGDGGNDAAALGAAHVGVGVRGGLEAALAHAAVYLTDPGPDSWRFLIRHSRGWVRRLRRVLYAAAGYNLLAIALVLGGAWGPWVCAAAMPASSLAVVLALGWGRPRAGRPA